MYRKSIVTLMREKRRRQMFSMCDAKKRIRTELAASSAIGSLQTSGIMGNHVIRILQRPDKPKVYYIEVDGKVTEVRTLRGVRNLFTEIFL